MGAQAKQKTNKQTNETSSCTPDDGIVHVRGIHSNFTRNLIFRSVMIQPGQSGEIFARYRRSAGHCNQCIGVSRIANNQNL